MHRHLWWSWFMILDHLTFFLVPLWSWHLRVRVKYLKNYSTIDVPSSLRSVITIVIPWLFHDNQVKIFTLNISATTRWIGSKLCVNINCSQIMIWWPNDLGDDLNFGWISVKCGADIHGAQRMYCKKLWSSDLSSSAFIGSISKHFSLSSTLHYDQIHFFSLSLVLIRKY